MIKNCLVIVLIIGVFSCSKKVKEETATTIPSNEPVEMDGANQDSINLLKEKILKLRIDIDKVEGLFKYQDLDEFDSSMAYEKGKYNLLTKEDYFKAFQDSSDYFLYYEPDYEGAYYYAKLKDWQGLKRYIFVKEDETCCTYYYYNIYDSTGKKTDSFVYGASGGDGGWVININSKILNDSTIEQVSVECEYGIDNNRMEIGQCDSIVTNLSLLPTGKVKTVKEQKFKIKK